MAEIEIQQKKRSPWGWIVGILALVLAVFVVAEVVDDDDEELGETEYGAEVMAPPVTETAPAQAVEPGTADGTSASIEQFTEAARAFDANEAGRQHEAAANVLQLMVPAIIAVAPDEIHEEIQPELEQLRESATQIQQTPWTADTHAGDVKAAFTAVADVLERLDRNGTDATDGSEVRQSAESIQADRPLLEQTDAVERFFMTAANELERIGRAGAG